MHSIKAKERTNDVINTENLSFEDLHLPDKIIKGLEEAGFINPSPIQVKAIPIGRFGNDLIAQGKAGTGKTCVFTVCILENIDYLDNNPQALILCPTREIALQTNDVIETIGKYYDKLKSRCIVGGLPFERHKEYIREGCQVIVGTPGRIQTLLTSGVLNPSKIKMLVLDEADQLFDEQFEDIISFIYSQLPTRKQVMAFSATFTPELIVLIKTFMKHPQFVSVTSYNTNINTVITASTTDTATSSINNNSNPIISKYQLENDICLEGVKQYRIEISNNNNKDENKKISKFTLKVNCLLYFLSHVSFHQCVIFINNKEKAVELTQLLTSRGWPTVYLAGHFTQSKRMQTFTAFREFRARILISTDLTARGVDIQRVNCVINFELPKTIETYLHRIGRTGRFGSYGISLILCSSSESKKVDEIEKEIGYRINPFDYSIDTSQYLPELDDIESSMLNRFEKERDDYLHNLRDWPFPLTELPSLQLLK